MINIISFIWTSDIYICISYIIIYYLSDSYDELNKFKFIHKKIYKKLS